MDIYYQNVNRMRSKCTETYLNILNCNHDIICFTETNLNSTIFDNEIFDSNFEVHRRDRETSASRKSDGGGVLIAVHNKFHTIRRRAWECDLEDLWISIIPSDSNQPVLNICVCYLPPDLPMLSLNNFYQNIQNVILKKDSNDIYLIIGDFNIPNITWIQGCDNIMLPGTSSDSKAHLLTETLAICDLKQFNAIKNNNNRILDLVLSNSNFLTVKSYRRNHTC